MYGSNSCLIKININVANKHYLILFITIFLALAGIKNLDFGTSSYPQALYLQYHLHAEGWDIL